MHRQELLKTIDNYRELVLPKLRDHKSFDQAEEDSAIEKFLAFINSSPKCFDRENLDGHITGSALVVDRTKTKVALTLHGKLGIWLQLGGHADSDPQIDRVAKREVEEESGLVDLEFILKDSKVSTPLPFDFDVHRIPARKDEPEHLHFDVRYLIQANDEKLQISDESDDLRWFTIPEACKVTSERSMLRQFDKLESIIQGS